MEKEIWRDIAGYEGLYQVSNLGNVKSLDRTVKHSNGRVKFLKGRLLKPKKIGTIYVYHGCSLSKNNVAKTFRFHTLVARTFLGEQKKNIDVDHIDRNKLNNRLDNLRYVTKSENSSNMASKGVVPFKGVTFQDRMKTVKENGKSYTYRYTGYVAGIRFQKKYTYLGKFKTPEEAYKAYCDKFLELYGYEYK